MNIPLSYKEQATFSLFIILLIPTCLLFGAGVIPTLAIFVGIYYAKARKDFGYLETAFKVVQYYIALFVIGLAVLAASEGVSIGLKGFIFVSSPILYLSMFNYAVVVPFRKHQTWVVDQGIYLNKERSETLSNTPWISFGKSSSILSVADELLKLNNLKEAKLLTQDEFDKLRNSLLS